MSKAENGFLAYLVQKIGNLLFFCLLILKYLLFIQGKALLIADLEGSLKVNRIIPGASSPTPPFSRGR
jgi:hypothetical protein